MVASGQKILLRMGSNAGVAPKISTPVFYNVGNINLTGVINGINVEEENRLLIEEEKTKEKTKENEDKQALIRKILTGDDYKNTVLKFDYSKHQVSLKDMDKYWDKKNVYILDLRSPEQYKSGHIKGALHLGADILEDKLRKLVPDKKATIIVYCNNSLFPTRMISLTDSCLPQFSALGYENVFSLAPIWHDSPTYNRSFMEGPHWVKGENGK